LGIVVVALHAARWTLTLQRGVWQTVAEIKEACATIRKAMVQINELIATMTPQNFNQMTRWVNTKEEHCCKIITTISGTFPLCRGFLLSV
jgi:hypothetical protein